MLGQIEGGSQDQSQRRTLQVPHQPTSTINNAVRSSANDGNTERHTREEIQMSTSVVGNHDDPSVDLAEITDNPYTGDSNSFSDYEWYGLSLAETGIEELAGFEPSNLFQQGWKIFS